MYVPRHLPIIGWQSIGDHLKSVRIFLIDAGLFWGGGSLGFVMNERKNVSRERRGYDLIKICGSFSFSLCLHLGEVGLLEWVIQFPSLSFSLSIRTKSRSAQIELPVNINPHKKKSIARAGNTFLPIFLFYFAQSPSQDSFHLSKKSKYIGALVYFLRLCIYFKPAIIHQSLLLLSRPIFI